MKRFSSILSIILFFILTNGSTISISGLNIQTNLVSLTVNPQNISITQGEGFNLTVVLLDESIPIIDAYFQFRDPNQVFELDIGESQNNFLNGTYFIDVNGNSTKSTVPGNHNVFLQAIVAENTIQEIAMNIIIDPIDNIDPVLIVADEDIYENFNQSAFILTLNGSDNNEWLDLNLQLGDKSIFYLKNSGIEIDLPNIKSNKTHLYYRDWVIFDNFDDIDASDFFIDFRDTSFNTARFGFNLTSDYVKPIVTLISHQSDQVIKSKTITLIWTVEEASVILSQDLLFDGRLFRPGGVVIGTNIRQLTFNLPVEDGGQVFTLAIKVTDEFDNWGIAEIRLIYDPLTGDDDNSKLNLKSGEIGNNAETFVLGGILLILSIILFFVGKSLLSLREDSEGKISQRKTKIESILKKNPFPRNYSNLNVATIKIIEDFLLTSIETIRNSPESQIKLEINDFENKLIFLKQEYNDNEKLISFIDHEAKDWLDTLKSRIGV